MANPNIVNVTTIYGQTALAALTTVTANVVTNSSGSNQVFKMDTIILSNYTSSAVGANVVINRSATTYYLAGSLSIPANSTLVLVGKDSSFYLLEGDVIQANVTANSSITFTASYEQIS
jgi:hypothetical protein